MTPGITFSPVDGAYVAVKRIDGVDYVMFRGWTTFLDWLEDFDMLAVPIVTENLGPVHPGFLAGVMAVKDSLDRLLGPQVVVAGHSLGAGHAVLYAALREAAGLPVTKLVLFGEPRAGGPKLVTVLAKTPIQSYCNTVLGGHDLVTDVPPALPPFTHYMHPETLISCTKAPDPNDNWGPFRFHHFGLYAAALGACGAAAKTLTGYG